MAWTAGQSRVAIHPVRRTHSSHPRLRLGLYRDQDGLDQHGNIERELDDEHSKRDIPRRPQQAPGRARARAVGRVAIYNRVPPLTQGKDDDVEDAEQGSKAIAAKQQYPVDGRVLFGVDQAGGDG